MFKQLATATAIVFMCSFAAADTYTDNVGNHLTGGDLHDFFQSQGFDHLDIVQTTVTNDASFLYIDITLNADIDATNWGKYLIGIDTGANVGENSNPWGRSVDWGRNITDFVGSWADDGGSGAGGQFWQFDGAVWNLTDSTGGGGLITASDAKAVWRKLSRNRRASF